MSTNEKKIKEQSERIVDTFVALSMGKEPNLLSNSIMKNLAEHSNFQRIKYEIIQHFQLFNGKIESKGDLKRLSDFRFKIYELYNVD